LSEGLGRTGVRRRCREAQQLLPLGFAPAPENGHHGVSRDLQTAARFNSVLLVLPSFRPVRVRSARRAPARLWRTGFGEDFVFHVRVWMVSGASQTPVLARAAANRPERVASPACEASTVWLETRIAWGVRSAQPVVWCGLTFELSRPWRQTPAGHGRTISTLTWSGQTVAAVAGRRLERGVRHQRRAASPEGSAGS
jgi:hypothetical protein